MKRKLDGPEHELTGPFFDDLPEEIYLTIFQEIKNSQAYKSAKTVSKDWNRILKDHTVMAPQYQKLEQEISTLLVLIEQTGIEYEFIHDIETLLASLQGGLDFQLTRNKLELILNKPNRNMRRLIHYSLKSTAESLALLKHIIKLGADVNITSGLQSSLGIAIKSLNVGAVDCLLKAGADINKSADFFSYFPNLIITPLSLINKIFTATKNRSIALVWIRSLLGQYATDQNGTDLFALKSWRIPHLGETLLHVACKMVDEDSVYGLLKSDLGHVNKQNHFGYTPLAALVNQGFSMPEANFISLVHLSEQLDDDEINGLMTQLKGLGCVSEEWERGVIQNSNTHQIEPIYFLGYRLIRSKFYERISTLGKDQFAQNLGVNVVVIDALEVTKAQHILNMLLRNGADQFIKTTDERIVMEFGSGNMAVICPLFKAAREQLSNEKYQLLCKDFPEYHYMYMWRVLINEDDDELEGRSPLHKFIDKFEHKNICDCDDPADSSCPEPEMWDWLLDEHNFLYINGQINHQDSSGETPIFSALRSENHIAVKALMDHGARADISNHEGNLPEEYSPHHGFRSLLDGNDYFGEAEYAELNNDDQEYGGRRYG